jgi:hypothetical protein
MKRILLFCEVPSNTSNIPSKKFDISIDNAGISKYLDQGGWKYTMPPERVPSKPEGGHPR